VTFLKADKVHHVNSRFEALFYCEIVLSVLFYLVAKEKDERRIQEDKERSHHTRG
jgi:hypothetical protein